MISFSSITDKPKTNLDDVSEWYITNTIIKDPVKGITTRRIIKVGENNDLLEAEDDSTDRNDAIMQFARNVNPMVSVQYNNVGSGFGRGGNNEAFLPYRIMKDGAFRPPIVDQRDLMPLSRQPRNTTSINTSAEFIDYSKGIKPSESALKRTEVLNTLKTIPMCSSKGYNFKTGMDEPYDVVYHIEDKPQRIKQAMYGGETDMGYSGDNIGKYVIDGVTSSSRENFRGNTIEGFVAPSVKKQSSNISTCRDEIGGMLEGSSGRIPIAKNDATWQQHPQILFKNPYNLNVVTNANGHVTKDNITRTELERTRNLPSYSVESHKTFKGLHINYLNGQEDRICTTGMINPNKQRKFYSYGNSGQGGGGGVKPMTIEMTMDRENVNGKPSFGSNIVKLKSSAQRGGSFIRD
jgi:hypothetical protein